MRRNVVSGALLLCVACAGVAFPGRGGFPAGANGTPPSAPGVEVADLRMVRGPSNAQLAAHYCARVAPALVCRSFGPAPREEDLRFVFDVELEIRNPNAVAIPVVSGLFAFEAFPDGAAQALGTACVTLCEDGDCGGDSEACRSSDPEIRDIDDFADATVGFLSSLAQGERRLQDLRVRTVAPGDRLRWVVSLELSVSQMVDLIGQAAGDALEAVVAGHLPALVVPYRLEGSIWISVEGFGRLAASFEPVSGEWVLR